MWVGVADLLSCNKRKKNPCFSSTQSPESKIVEGGGGRGRRKTKKKLYFFFEFEFSCMCFDTLLVNMLLLGVAW